MAEQPSYYPADLPEYMKPAWSSALLVSCGRPEVMVQFRKETGNRWKPSETVIEQMIDEVSGHADAFAGEFIAWFNDNVWGSLEV